MATIEIGPHNGRVVLHTRREGIGGRVGHDLVIDVCDWRGTVDADVSDIEAASIEVSVDAASLEVREGRGGALPLTMRDRGEISKNIAKVLLTSTTPEITFRSTGVRRTDDGAEVAGELTVRGKTAPVTLSVTGDEAALHAEATVRHSDFGIRPYSAMLGALRVRDDVAIEIDLRLTP